ncbi:MAG: hypothetical protein M0R80_13450 [Proteobacteria bacterium]|jgi:hypothetical protein|nr:hypothetical protein [Pseudomonadota bacterium]
MISPYLSPSGVLTYLRDETEFYVRYVLGHKTKTKQTMPMAIGTCFDAIVKARISEALLGKKYSDVFDQLIGDSIEALPYGQHCWTEYRDSGAFADLMLELNLAVAEPRMELEVRDTVFGVPMLGKPDLYFVTKTGAQVIYDFKVNGYMNPTSPKPGYLVTRFRGQRSSYKTCKVTEVQGIRMNTAMLPQFGSSVQDWLIQLCMYSWILGEPIGTETVMGIDQITSSDGPYSDLRISSYRFQVERSVQMQLRDLITLIWKRMHSDDWPEGLDDPIFR